MDAGSSRTATIKVRQDNSFTSLLEELNELFAQADLKDTTEALAFGLLYGRVLELCDLQRQRPGHEFAFEVFRTTNENPFTVSFDFIPTPRLQELAKQIRELLGKD